MSVRRTAALLLLVALPASSQAGCSWSGAQTAPTATPVSELPPGEWRSTSLTSATSEEFTDPADALSLTVSKDGYHRLTIDDGCNVQSGPFHLADGVLSVSELSSTLAACEPPRGDAGYFVSDLLSAPVAVTRSGGVLSWKNSIGEITFAESP